MIEPKGHLKAIVRTKIQEPSRMFKYRLDRNERNQPFSRGFIENIKKNITDELFMMYPELDKVYAKLAEWLKLDVNQIMLHSGSEQAIKAIFETYIIPGDLVLLHSPGFAMYKVYCEMFQAHVISQYFDSELNFDWSEYNKKITKDLRMVVVENPNGFLGIAPSLEQIQMIVDKAHSLGVIALIDEAYFHFQNVSVIDWIEKYDKLIITRSFSKAFGLAGLRAGYLISQHENIYSLQRVRPAYDINCMAAFLISELLDNIDELMVYVNETKRNLVDLRKGFSEMGIPTSISKANFTAARLGNQKIHDEFREALSKQNILIRRPFREELLKEWVRISTAPQEIQNILLAELRKILNKKNKMGKNACL